LYHAAALVTNVLPESGSQVATIVRLRCPAPWRRMSPGWLPPG